MPLHQRMTKAEKIKARKEAQARAAKLEEESDNDGTIIARKMRQQAGELAGIVQGASRSILKGLTSDFSAGMQTADFEESAWYGAFTNDVDEIISVQACDQNVDAPLGKRRTTPFYIACATGALEAVEYLTSTPGLVGDLNAGNDRTGATPFFAACAGGHADVVKFLAAKRRPASQQKQQQKGKASGNDGREASISSPASAAAAAASALFAVDIEKPNGNGISPWEMARANGDEGVLAALAFARGVRREEEAAILQRSAMLSTAKTLRGAGGGGGGDGEEEEGEDDE